MIFNCPDKLGLPMPVQQDVNKSYVRKEPKRSFRIQLA